MSDHIETYKEFVGRYLKRAWTVADGLPEQDIKKAEARLGIQLPAALKNFYLSIGGASDFCSIHNIIFHPKDLEFREGYLVFMDENQSVVSWGIKKEDLTKGDPTSWQRNNSWDKWYSEEKSFTEFMTSMFDWYEQSGVWKHLHKKHGSGGAETGSGEMPRSGN